MDKAPRVPWRIKRQHELEAARQEQQRDQSPDVHLSAVGGFLRRLLCRSHLSPKEQAAILNLKGWLSPVKIHHDIVSSGVAVKHCYLVVDGVIASFDQTAGGRRQITALHFAGDMCNLHSAVWPLLSSGLEALTDGNIFLIALDELRALTGTYPTIAKAFWLDTAADASVCAKWVTKLGRGEAHERLAHLLCEIGMRMERAGLAARCAFPMPMAQVQLGDALGLSPFYLNRTLQMLQQDGVIQKREKMILVPDWDRLSTMGAFDPGFLLLPEMEHAEPPPLRLCNIHPAGPE
jgi:CRP-like cAMP-binding protein